MISLNASVRAQQLDQKILQDAAPISEQLGDLVSFATAQVYGSTQLTIAIDEYGQFNKSDMMAFMQNMGGLGDERESRSRPAKTRLMPLRHCICLPSFHVHRP
jgi:hypothetical protein